MVNNKFTPFMSESDDEEVIMTTHEQDNICKVLKYYSIIGIIEFIIILFIVLFL